MDDKFSSCRSRTAFRPKVPVNLPYSLTNPKGDNDIHPSDVPSLES